MPDTYTVMDKLTGLAALFGPEGVTGNRSLSVEACNGISIILEDCVKELDRINEQIAKQGGIHHLEINKLNTRIKELHGGAHG